MNDPVMQQVYLQFTLLSGGHLKIGNLDFAASTVESGRFTGSHEEPYSPLKNSEIDCRWHYQNPIRLWTWFHLAMAA